MTRLVLFLRAEESWEKLLPLLVLIALPLAARLIKWLLASAGVIQPEGSKDEDAAASAARRRSAREERRRAEAEGQELWRRLGRGEVSAPAPPPRAPAPVADESSLELETEPAPLSVLGEVRDPAEVPAVSLESEEEPLPLSALAQPAALAPGEPVEPARRGFVLARGDLRRAVILSEILGPPLCDRPLRA